LLQKITELPSTVDLTLLALPAPTRALGPRFSLWTYVNLWCRLRLARPRFNEPKPITRAN